MIVLASRSRVRVELLRAAGVDFDTDAADLDEDALVVDVKDPAEQARLLARAKALHVSKRQPGLWVLGGDQTGCLDDGTPLRKPNDRADQAAQLLEMAQQPHRFFPAVCLVKDGVVVDEAADSARIVFRAFDAAVAAAYAATGEGEGSCGGYEIEHRGAQLVARVDGSLQAVLGFPLLLLLPLLQKHCAAEAGLLAAR